MKRILIVFALLSLIMIGCTPPTDPANASIVGDWGIGGVKAMSFTASGTMTTYSESVTISYGYTAAGGSGEYWSIAAPDTKVGFTYSITGDTLVFTLTSLGVSVSYTRL